MNEINLKVNPVRMSGKEVWPLIEGGKGIGASNGLSAGAFAAAGAIGTFSGVFASYINEYGVSVPLYFKGKTRKERHYELVEHSIKAAISQAKIAKDISGGNGLIHMNVLWEMGGAQRILSETLEQAHGLIDGITCGAGMPYKLADIAAKYKVRYYPIVSSARAARALWIRSYSKLPEMLGGFVYEDPWLAGGHNGISNADSPDNPMPPYDRVVDIRNILNKIGAKDVPIIMAGGVWNLSEWSHWINNPDLGQILFQFGTRPLLTKESPIPKEWKEALLKLKEEDVILNKFSPTGFYSSAVRNSFIEELISRNNRQVDFKTEYFDNSQAISIGNRNRNVFVSNEDAIKISTWQSQGFSEAMKTPDDTLIFVSSDKKEEILNDQRDCKGCLSGCKFSNWKESGLFTTGLKTDPRSFCIQKTLYDIISGGSIEDNLMFSGHVAYRFSSDPLYANGFIPTVSELIDAIIHGK